MKRTSIYLGPRLGALIEMHRSDSRSVSSLLDTVAGRYHYLVVKKLPALSEPEWALIFDALNGVWHDQPQLAVSGLAHGIADAIAMDGLGDKWDVDGDTLVGRIEGMDAVEKLAVIDAAERWWSSDRLGADSFRDALAKVVGEGKIAH